MTFIQEPKWLIFKENSYEILKLHSVGYDDFGKKTTGDFWTTNMWHALYFAQNGSGSLTMQGRTYELKKGDFYFVTPNEPLRYYSEEQDPLRYYWFAFYPELAGEISTMLGLSQEEPVRAAIAPQQVERIFESLLEARSATTEFYFTALSALMQILTTEYAGVSTGRTTVRHEAFAENVKQLIELNYNNPEFHIEAVARMLYVSHAHMTRIFREIEGITPVNYLIELRLQYAAKRLRECEDSIKMVCEASGFQDEWHFMKSFKKRFGMTVREYRERE